MRYEHMATSAFKLTELYQVWERYREMWESVRGNQVFSQPEGLMHKHRYAC